MSLLWLALAAAEDTVHVQTTLVVQVADVVAARDKVVAAAEARGGWFSSLSDTGVVLQVPVADAEALEGEAKALGRVVDRSFTRTDLAAQLRDQRNGLAARERTLDRYFAVLDNAHANAVVTVEREITQLVADIEGYKGRIRRLEHEASVAQVDVSFRFRDRDRPTPTGSSSFAWVNRVTLDDLLGSFRHGWTERRVPGVVADPPPSFAAWPAKRGIRALSTDDVAWRARRFRNKPAADLPYWKETLGRTLTEAGYRLLSEGVVGSGALLEWSAPDGERDATWLVALYVDGGSLVVVEAAGEARVVAARREAIVVAMAEVLP